MGDLLRTSVAQFSSLGGVIRHRAVNMRAVEPAADLPGAERGKLYILVEVTGSGGGHAALYRQLLTAAQTAFYEASGGLSAALIRAVRNAHAVLVRTNEALPEAEWRAGISCVAFQGEEILIAQAGPALAMISHPRTIDQFPARPGLAGVALGGAERPEVELYRTTVEPGSMILLAQSNWLNAVSAEALAAVSAADSPRLAHDYLAQLAGDAELSALLVAFNTALPEVHDEPLPISAPPRSTPPASEPVVASMRIPAVARPPVSEPAEIAEPAPRSSRPLVGPTPADEPAPLAEETGRRSPWALLLALVIIPVIIVLLVLGMLWLRTRNADAQFQQILTGAETAITEARGLSDEPAARLRLGNAHDFLEKARALRPTDPKFLKVETAYSEVLGRVNHITPLYGLLPLWQFKETGRRLERVLVGGDSLFVLDLGKHEIDRFILSKLGDSVTPADPSMIVRKGQPVGNTAVSDLVDIDWAAAVGNQRSRLLGLDTAGGLLSYDVTWGAARLPIVGREKWGLPQLVKTYGGNLYVVDTKAQQIWRYRPSEKGYENAPEPYFQPVTKVDLSGVQSIEIDGNVWLLFADGRLLKFFAGEQKPFEFKGLPDPLSAPTVIAAQRDGDLIYVADAGNGRILEFTKDGQFQRQFRPAEGNALQGIRDIFLDEAGDKLYILTADRLFKADVPRVPASVKPSN